MKNFIKNKEDFVCEQCGASVVGSGYTNHCPRCLYSKHVDIIPGDRAHACEGLMQPIQVKQKGKEYILTHKCLVCDTEKNNKLSKNDNFEAVFSVIK